VEVVDLEQEVEIVDLEQEVEQKMKQKMKIEIDPEGLCCIAGKNSFIPLFF